MPYAGICTVSARQDDEREMCVVRVCRFSGICIFCCRTAAISAPFTPLSTFRFQPLPAVVFLAIDVDITFHYITSQFSAFSSALVGSVLLSVPWRCRCSQISTFTNLTITRRHCSQVSQRWQPHAVIHGYQQAQVAKPWGRRSHPITLGL